MKKKAVFTVIALIGCLFPFFGADLELDQSDLAVIQDPKGA